MLAKLTNPKFLRGILPAVSFAILLGAIFYMQPRAMSYFGLNLMLQYAVRANNRELAFVQGYRATISCACHHARVDFNFAEVASDGVYQAVKGQ